MRIPIYECECGLWSRQEYKFTEDGRIPVCDCGKIMTLKFKVLPPLDPSYKMFQPEMLRSVNPKRKNTGKKSSGGRPRKEEGMTQHEKRAAEASVRKANGETRGRKCSR